LSSRPQVALRALRLLRVFSSHSAGLWGLEWTDSFRKSLPADEETANYVRQERTFPVDKPPSLTFRRCQVHGACYSLCSPTPAPAPQILSLSAASAALLGVSPSVLTDSVDVFGGTIPPSLQPWAACYGGHQFGGFAGQLGDGRAISIGEVSVNGGDRWELQLKGAGRTPYSRQGDGKAVLR